MSPLKRAVSSILPASYAGRQQGKHELPTASLESLVLKIGKDGRATTEVRITASLDEDDEEEEEEEEERDEADDKNEAETKSGRRLSDAAIGHFDKDKYLDDDDADDDEDDEDENYESDESDVDEFEDWEGNESDVFSDFEADYQHILNPPTSERSREERKQTAASGNTRLQQKYLTGSANDDDNDADDDDIFAPGAMPDLAINDVRAAAVFTPKSRSQSRTFSRSNTSFVSPKVAAAPVPSRSMSARVVPSHMKLEQVKLKYDRLTSDKKAQVSHSEHDDLNGEDNEDEEHDDDFRRNNETNDGEGNKKCLAQAELRDLLARNKNKPREPVLLRPTKLNCPPQQEDCLGAALGSSASTQRMTPLARSLSSSPTKACPATSATVSSQPTRDSTPTPVPLVPATAAAVAVTSAKTPSLTQAPDPPELSAAAAIDASSGVRGQQKKQLGKLTPPTNASLLKTPAKKKHTFVQYTPTPKGKGRNSKALTKQVQQPSPSPRNRTLKTSKVPSRRPAKISQAQQQQQQQPPLPPSSPPLVPYSQSGLQLAPILPAPQTCPPPSSPATITDPDVGTSTPLANSSFESVWSRTGGGAGKSDRSRLRAKRRPSNPSNGTRCVCQSTEIGGHLMVQCSICSFWLHTRCVGLERQRLPTNYICALCAHYTGGKPLLGAENIHPQMPKMAEMRATSERRAKVTGC
ncbi:hypothetical protein KEM54_000279 [Ascosphaera aggregata]|nr:hypothetical protein KEM54_000279 [Ascosphaera aggregata]